MKKLSYVAPLPACLLAISAYLPPRVAYVFVPLAFILLGCVACGLQTGIVRYVTLLFVDVREERRRRCIGVCLAFVEVCIAAGMIISPPIVAILATRVSLASPYMIITFLQASAALFVCFTHEDIHTAQTSAQDSTPSERVPILGGYKTEEMDLESMSDEDDTVWHVLRHPWVWVVLVAMVMSAASAAFLRPVLTLHVLSDGHSVIFASCLFSLTALTVTVFESLTATVISPRIGIRNTVIIGLLISALGFHMVVRENTLVLGIVLISAGSSMSLIMSLCDVAQTTDVDVSDAGGGVSLLAAFVFSFGEILGTLCAGALVEIWGWGDGLDMWVDAVSVAVCIVGVIYLVGLAIQILRPFRFLFGSGGRVSESSGRRILLS